MKRPAQNILALFASDGVVRLLGFVTTAFMARVLDPGAFGTVNFGMAVLSYGLLFSSPGLHIIGALRVADASVEPALLVRTITRLRAFLAALFCAAAGGAWFFGANAALAAPAFFFSCVLLPLSFQVEWYFQGKESLTVAAAGKIIAALVFSSAVIIGLTAMNYRWLVPVWYGAGMTAQAALLWIAYRRSNKLAAARKTLSPSSAPARYSWRMLVRQSLPVGAAVIGAQALLNFPSIALGILSTTAEVARFSAAAKLVFFALAIDRVMYAVFFPFVARVHANAPLSLPQHLERITKYIFLLCVPICIGGSLLAPRLLEAVYGPHYAAAAPLLQIQLWYFFFTILNSLFSYPLIATGHERYYGTATTVIAGATIVLLVPLIYFFTSVGASVGLVAGEFALAVSMALKAGKLFPSRSFAHIVKPLLCALVMGCFLVIFSYISLFLLIPAGVLVYLLAAAAVKAVDRHDMRFLKERLV